MQSKERNFLRINALLILHNIYATKARSSDRNVSCNLSNATMRTGLDFKSPQFDQVRGEAEESVYFTRYPSPDIHAVLSCEQNKAIWLANLLMNY
jgi:hypothetical protein